MKIFLFLILCSNVHIMTCCRTGYFAIMVQWQIGMIDFCLFTHAMTKTGPMTIPADFIQVSIQQLFS